MNFKLALIILLTVRFVDAQTTDNLFCRHDSNNIYFQALYNGFYKGLSIPKTNNINPTDTIFIKADGAITDSLIDRFGQFKIIVLNTEQLKSELKNKKEIMIYQIFPIKIKHRKYSISFSPKWVTDTGTELSFDNSGEGCTVHFKRKGGQYCFVNVDCYGPD